MTDIKVFVVVKHDRDTVPETHAVFGVYNNYRYALTAVLTEFGKVRTAMSLPSLEGRAGDVLVDTETEPGVVWVDDTGLDSGFNFSITRATVKEM